MVICENGGMVFVLFSYDDFGWCISLLCVNGIVMIYGYDVVLCLISLGLDFVGIS